MNIRLSSFAMVTVTVLLAGCERGATPPTAEAPEDREDAASVLVANPAPSLREYTGATPAPQEGYCSLDSINGGDPGSAPVRTGVQATFAGWLADARLTVPPDALLVLRSDDESYAIPVDTGAARPDVATALASETLAHAGFGATAMLDLMPGTYALSVVVNQGTGGECDLNKRLQVVE